VECLTRMGDGTPVKMTKEQIKAEIEDGTKDAARRAHVPVLTGNEIEYLVEIVGDPSRIVSVVPGKEAVVSHDVGPLKVMADQSNSGVSIPCSREQAMCIYEKAFASDTTELGHIDYSFKPVKPIITQEMSVLQNVNLITTIPVFYGAMPNLGLYYAPDGPFQEPIALIKEGKMAEARQAMESAAHQFVEDIEYITTRLYSVGLDALNIDTTAAGGDADFYGTLHAVENLKKSCPDLSIEMGMAGEFIFGFHTQLEYDGTRLAGLFPHQQVKLAEKAGVDIFGPVVNTKPSKPFAYNVARAVTMVKQCVKDSKIPIHVNMGMGVGGIPMYETPPIDAVTRANKAMIEIAGVDGL